MEELKLTPLPIPHSSQTSLAQISTAQAEMAKVKHHLDSLVDILNDNASIITRAANFWGPLPIWQKALITIALFAPIITLGVLGNILALTTAACVAAAAYMIGGLLVDNHYKGNKRCRENVKQGITSMANILEAMITALDKIREQLASEIEKFKVENVKLGENIELLRVEVSGLSAVEERLEFITLQYEELTRAFTSKVAELAEVKSSMGAEIERLQHVGLALQGAVETLTGTVITDGKARVEFLRRLETFLADNKASFDSIAERICAAERKLAERQAALELSNKQLALISKRLELTDKLYTTLLDRQAREVTRLGRVASRHEEESSIKQGRHVTMFRPKKVSTLVCDDEPVVGRTRAYSVSA